MLAEAETWVLVAFLLFVGLMIYLKAPQKLAVLLDERSARIAKELAEARRLREEAQALLADYHRRRVEAEKTAADIVALAQREALTYAEESRRKLQETLERRVRQAEQKIAQAEVQAVKEVRGLATDLAVAAATGLIGEAVRGPRGSVLVDDSIAALKGRLG